MRWNLLFVSSPCKAIQYTVEADMLRRSPRVRFKDGISSTYTGFLSLPASKTKCQPLKLFVLVRSWACRQWRSCIYSVEVCIVETNVRILFPRRPWEINWSRWSSPSTYPSTNRSPSPGERCRTWTPSQYSAKSRNSLRGKRCGILNAQRCHKSRPATAPEGSADPSTSSVTRVSFAVSFPADSLPEGVWLG